MKGYTRNKLRRGNLAWPDGRSEARIVQLCAGRGRLGHARTAMTQYLLSVHSVDGEAGEPMTDEQVRDFLRLGGRSSR